MLVRQLGKETEAKNVLRNIPLMTCQHGLIKSLAMLIVITASGVSADKFGSNDTVSAVQYLTFVLRALGYSDSKEVTDFTWDNLLIWQRKLG